MAGQCVEEAEVVDNGEGEESVVVAAAEVEEVSVLSNRQPKEMPLREARHRK